MEKIDGRETGCGNMKGSGHQYNWRQIGGTVEFEVWGVGGLEILSGAYREIGSV